MIEKYIVFYENCVLTKGHNRCLVSDIQKNESELMPIEFYDFVSFLKNKTSIKDLIIYYGEENKKHIKEYLNFIIEKEWGFYANRQEFDLFSKMEFKFNHISKITNAVIQIEKLNIKELQKIIFELEKLSCKDLVIIFQNDIKLKEINKLNIFFQKTRFKSLELYIKYNDNLEDLKINILTRVVLYNSTFNKVIPFNKNNFFDVIYTTKNLQTFKFCGVINLEYFNTNDSKVLESINHNSCLHKKISIDKEGNIKNCPAMPQSFGNIKDTTLEEALNHPDFKKYWNVTKDMIQVCKDCEFRHICTDCRAYTERTHFEEDIDLSKPLKCGYNPYTNEWAEWSTNPLKQKAIEYYGMQELVNRDL
ncbi:MAG: grasp-with-spasm system SPASM domain peptide maturase [Flavobacterium sp.]